MTRNQELAKNTIVLTIGRICTQSISFFLLPLYTAILKPEEYGIFDLLTTYVALLVPIFNLELDMGLFRFLLDIRQDNEKQKKLFSTIFLANIFQALIFGGIYLIVYRYLSFEYKEFLLIDVLLTIFLNILLQYCRGIGKNLQYSFASFLSASITVLLNVVFIAILHIGIIGMFYANIISKSITIFYLFIEEKIYKIFNLKSVNVNILKKVIKYSLPLIPNQFSWWIIGSSDRIIISKVLGLGINGIYSVANKFSSLYVTFYNVFNLAWTETVSVHIDDHDNIDFLNNTIDMLFKLFTSISFIIIALMPFLFNLFIGESYNEAYNQIPILMIAVLFQMIVGLYSAVYTALKKSSEVAKTSFDAAIINIVIDLIFIHSIGLYAASISTLVAFMIMAIYRYYHIKKYIDIKLNRKTMIFSLIMGVIIIILYYINKYIINCMLLLVVLAYSILINKKLIHSISKEIKDKFFQFRNKYRG